MRSLLPLLVLALPLPARAKEARAQEKLDACQSELAAATATADVHRKAGEYAIARAQELQDELQRIANAMQAAAAKIEGSTPIKIEIEEGRMVTKLPGGVLFESGDTTLKPEGKELLTAVIGVLQSAPDRKLLLAGHTDNQPISTSAKGFKTNLQLSVGRAIAAYEYLQANGVDPKRMGVAGYGEFDPDADNSTEDGRAKNRRLEIILFPTPEEMQTLGPLDTMPNPKPVSPAPAAPAPTSTPAPTPPPSTPPKP